MAIGRTVTIDMGRAEQEMRDQYGDRERVTLYLSKGLYDEFRELCQPVAASAGLQILMKEFIQAAHGVQKSRNKRSNKLRTKGKL